MCIDLREAHRERERELCPSRLHNGRVKTRQQKKKKTPDLNQTISPCSPVLRNVAVTRDKSLCRFGSAEKGGGAAEEEEEKRISKVH